MFYTRLGLTKYLFKHVLSQEMGFFDSKTVSEIKSAMNPEAIIRLICLEVPVLVAEVLNLVFIVSHIISINYQLTIISIGFIILGRLIRYPIEKVNNNALQPTNPACTSHY